MKFLFVIAMHKEALDIINYYKLEKITETHYKKDNIDLIITKESRNGITSKLASFIIENKIDTRDYIMINIGMAGSNKLKVNDVYQVDKSYGYNYDFTPFGDPLYHGPYSPFELNKLNNYKSYDCYTSDGFVTQTSIEKPALFDMELNSIITFPFKENYSIKIISDSLSKDEYINFNYKKALEKAFIIVNEIIKK